MIVNLELQRIESDFAMQNSKSTRRLASVLGQLGWTILLGLGLSVVFFLLVLRGPLNSEMTVRYFVSHPVSYCATAMFVIGLVALSGKLVQVLVQYAGLTRTSLNWPDGEIIDPREPSDLSAGLKKLPSALRKSYLGCRLQSAVDFLSDRQSVEGLDEEMKYQADMDATRQHESFALVRILIWATPMLGFLGTVIGITQALGDLDPSELANNIQAAMDKLLAGLYVAFDTTALALTLSIVLMFFQFLVDRLETELLAAVDIHTNHELRGRFSRESRNSDPYLASVERMSSAVIRTSEHLVKRQAHLWEQSWDRAQERWATITEDAAGTVTTSFQQALSCSLSEFSDEFAAGTAATVSATQNQWQNLVEHVEQAKQQFDAQQVALQRHTEVLQQVVQATDEICKLESVLNENLQTVAVTGNFEHAVTTLSAAAQLLVANLGAPAVPRVDIPTQGNAERVA